jgi:hypothetical protein
VRHEDAVAAIVAGDHGDPLSFLRMHEAQSEPVVWAFLPDASTVEYNHPGMYGLHDQEEAVRELRGECDDRQVQNANVALVH